MGIEPITKPTTVAFDITLMRPACVLIAAGMGADIAAASSFNAEDWLVEPTPDMKVYPVTPDQLANLVKMVAARKLPSPAICKRCFGAGIIYSQAEGDRIDCPSCDGGIVRSGKKK